MVHHHVHYCQEASCPSWQPTVPGLARHPDDRCKPTRSFRLSRDLHLSCQPRLRSISPPSLHSFKWLDLMRFDQQAQHEPHAPGCFSEATRHIHDLPKPEGQVVNHHSTAQHTIEQGKEARCRCPPWRLTRLHPGKFPGPVPACHSPSRGSMDNGELQELRRRGTRAGGKAPASWPSSLAYGDTWDILATPHPARALAHPCRPPLGCLVPPLPLPSSTPRACLSLRSPSTIRPTHNRRASTSSSPWPPGSRLTSPRGTTGGACPGSCTIGKTISHRPHSVSRVTHESHNHPGTIDRAVMYTTVQDRKGPRPRVLRTTPRGQPPAEAGGYPLALPPSPALPITCYESGFAASLLPPQSCRSSRGPSVALCRPGTASRCW